MKLAIISGGSRGLGQALGEIYQSRQWQVLEFSRAAPHPWSVHVDLAQPAAARAVFVEHLRRLAAQTWDEIVVIANAGVIEPIGPTSLKDPAAVLANIQTNYASPVLLMTEAVGAFQAHACRKTVLNISSGAALHSFAGWSLYCGAKAGLEHFVRTVAIEQAAQPQPLRLFNINPGVIDTGMQEAIRAAAPTDFPAVGRFIERHEQGELRAPATVAGAIVRIVDEAPDASGARIDIAGYLGA